MCSSDLLLSAPHFFVPFHPSLFPERAESPSQGLKSNPTNSSKVEGDEKFIVVPDNANGRLSGFDFHVALVDMIVRFHFY